MLLQGGTLSYLLKSKSYYTTEKYVMISQKEGQHFGLCDQSKIFLFLPLLTLFVRLVCVWSLTVEIVSSNIGEDFIVSKLSETFCLPSVLNRNCVHTNHQSRRKKIKNCASISCTHINHILGMLILVTYAGSTLLNCMIQPF